MAMFSTRGTRGIGTIDDFGGDTGYNWDVYGYDAAGNTDASVGMPGAQGASLVHISTPGTKSFFDTNKTAIYMAAGAFFLFTFLGGTRR